MTTTPSARYRLAAVAVLAGATWFATGPGPAAAQEAPGVTVPLDTTVPAVDTASASASAARQASSTSLELSKSTGLDRAGELISVTGHGFTPGQGVYVMFCAEPTGPLGTETGRADTCNPDQSNDHTVWKTPIGADGVFTVDLRVESGFEATDCTATACGVFVRRDHMGGASDYSQDAFATVSFASPATPTDPATPTEPAQPASGAGDPTTVQGATNAARLADTGASSALAATVGITLLALGGAFLRLARRHRPASRA